MSEETPRKRLPRHRRVSEDERPPMALTERDCAVIRTVNDYRAVTTDQLEALFFGSRSTAQYRLSRLFQHEFLDRNFLSVISGAPGSSQAIYTLGKRGVGILVERFGYERSQIRLPKRGTLGWHLVEHLLKVNDLRVMLTLAAQAQHCTLETWLDETTFRAKPDYVTVKDKGGRARKKPVFPDGYFVLQTLRGKARFFLEVDRGTELLSKFAPQIAVYEAYVASRQYQERFQARSLRILVVTTSERRLQSLRQVTEKSGGNHKYWFTTFERLTTDTILTAAIWQRLGSEALLAIIGEE